MIRYLILFSYFLMAIPLGSNAQSEKPHAIQVDSISSYSLKADAFYGKDDFKSMYYSIGDVLYKKGEINVEFYDISLGSITTVDITNPLQVVVFYRDTQTVIFLDNRFNETLRIALSEIKPYRFIEHVKLAGERRLWLINQDEKLLELYDYANDRIVFKSTIINSTILGIYSNYNFCHVLTSTGILSFNSYGSIIYTKEITDIAIVCSYFDGLVYVSNGDLYLNEIRPNKSRISQITADTSAGIKITEILKENGIQNLYLNGRKLYLYDRNNEILHEINLQKD